MKRFIAISLSPVVVGALLFQAGCDTKAGAGATLPKDKIGTPSKGPMSSGDQGGGGAGSVAPQVLPPPPSK